jgi:hypothetical protein
MMWLLVRAKDNADVDIYTVHERPDVSGDVIERAASLVFVRDGFSWGAALFSPVYFAVKGQWFAFLAYLAIALALSALLVAAGASDEWIVLVFIGLNIFLGFEASTLEKMWLEYRGWREVGTVAGRNLPECERRFFETWLATQPPRAEVTSLPVVDVMSWRRLFGARA